MRAERPATLRELQLQISSFDDPKERAIAEDAFFNSYASSIAPKKQIVVLLHGMNTNAEWQEALAEPIRNETSLEPLVVGYGNFHPVKFFIPLIYRIGRIQRVRRDLLGIQERNPGTQISIVAHSFGTYVLTNILRTTPELKFHRVILCGSIVCTDYDWTAVANRISIPVVNDIGRHDIWPSMAKSWSWGYGDSGAVGFKHSVVRDRHFEYHHSEFMTVDHMRSYWLPYLIDGRIAPSSFTSQRTPMKFVERTIRSASWRHVIIIGATAVGLLKLLA